MLILLREIQVREWTLIGLLTPPQHTRTKSTRTNSKCALGQATDEAVMEMLKHPRTSNVRGRWWNYNIL